MIYKLPHKYISYSQISLWENSPKMYKEIYFYGRKFENSAMIFGKQFAEALEKGTKDKMTNLIMSFLPQYKISEKKLFLKKDGLNIIGYADSYNPKTHAIREYKTGVIKWTQEKVDKHEQLTIYAMLIYFQYKKIPEMHLDWIETINQNGIINFTGKIKTFKTKRTKIDILKMFNKAKRIAKEISETYQKEFNNLI